MSEEMSVPWRFEVHGPLSFHREGSQLGERAWLIGGSVGRGH